MIRKTVKMKAVEANFGKTIEDLVAELMPKLGSQKAVADALGISKQTLFYWLNVLGFEKVIVLSKRFSQSD
jgi:transcriptional regulator with PAS, ATPase and Fis domain